MECLHFSRLDTNFYDSQRVISTLKHHGKQEIRPEPYQRGVLNKVQCSQIEINLITVGYHEPEECQVAHQ